jgi:hypothetical protein
MTELNLQNSPDDEMNDEENEDGLAPGMHVVGEGDDGEEVVVVSEGGEEDEDEDEDDENDEDDEEDEDEDDKDEEEVKDGLQALDEMAKGLDEPPLDLGQDE